MLLREDCAAEIRYAHPLPKEFQRRVVVGAAPCLVLHRHVKFGMTHHLGSSYTGCGM
ncbi:MAG: hypothetical protein WDA18_00675 [Candidatus Ratteibacteria bacterium]